MAWYYKSDLRLKGDTGWTAYDDEENEIIEEAYQAGKKIVAINDTYKISFTEMIQYRKTDKNRQREIKREEVKKKKQKVIHEALVGRTVYVVGSNIVGVFATKEDARKAKAKYEKSKDDDVDVHEKSIK